MIPESLEDWTYDSIVGLIARNIGESDRHDFKADIPHKTTLTKICCAFANTKGGFLILGVKEEGSRFKIEGIFNEKDLAHKFGQKINAIPTIGFDLPRIINIPDSDKILAVFHIPLSHERPHIPSAKEQRIFWKRTNQGNEQMSYEEIRMSFLNYDDRREKVKMLYIEMLSNYEMLGLMNIDEAFKETQIPLDTLDSSVITNLLIDLYTIIGKNDELVKTLMSIRNTINIINSRTKFALSQLSPPTTGSKKIARSHNEFMDKSAKVLRPLLLRAMKILEDEFNLKLPYHKKS